MKTNELKKGDRVRLRNGWFATIADNMKGNTRMATVEGDYTETGSVYAHDIVLFYPKDQIIPVQIEHTDAQKKLMKMVEEMF
jgi:hypothetical protein